jgi:hypothetical protein
MTVDIVEFGNFEVDKNTLHRRPRHLHKNKNGRTQKLSEKIFPKNFRPIKADKKQTKTSARKQGDRMSL